MLSAFPNSRLKPAAHIPPRLLAVSLGLLISGCMVNARAQTSTVLAPPPGDSMFSPQTPAAEEASPIRLTLAHEAAYKVEKPERVVKNRSSVQLEYASYFFGNFFVQFKGKTTAFLGKDHRRGAERTDAQVSQAYIQTSTGETSFKVGIQTLPWGESLLAAVTDEISPRDNRELFNFNLEELRLGQPMAVVDQYSTLGRWSAFWVPDPSFNKNPEKGTAYYFDPFTYRAGIEGDDGAEYGVSWRKNFESSDITFMAASLLDNDYGLRMNDGGTVTRVGQRFSLAGLAFTYAIRNFVIRGEAAVKSPKAYNNAALQLVEKKAIDTYLGVDYRYSSSLTFSIEAMNQRIADWNKEIQGVPRDRQSVLFSLTKTLMNDDLSINLLHFRNMPYRSNLTILMNTLKWDDHLTLGLNVIYPDANDRRNGLWNVRDQKQIAFKVQYQF